MFLFVKVWIRGCRRASACGHPLYLLVVQLFVGLAGVLLGVTVVWLLVGGKLGGFGVALFEYELLIGGFMFVCC